MSSPSPATCRSARAPASSSARGRSFVMRTREQGHRVPGNHDVGWWKSPLGLGDERTMYANYREYIDDDLEPVLRVAGRDVRRAQHGARRDRGTR